MDYFLDAEKLLLTLYKANKMGIPISTETINSYIYLLRNQYKIPFYYAFRFNPLPYSEELIDDLGGLRNGGNITYKSPIVVTDKGSKRIEKKMTNLEEIANNIEKALKEISGWDNKLIFQAIYNTITN